MGIMSRDNNEAKLIFISEEQKQKLLEIQNEVSEHGGDISMNQLIRDAINILIDLYKSEIVKKYEPFRLETK